MTILPSDSLVSGTTSGLAVTSGGAMALASFRGTGTGRFARGERDDMDISPIIKTR